MTNIDIADFDGALSRDTDRCFHTAVQTFLAGELAEVRRQMQSGLAPLDFERARKIEAAIRTADDVIRFSSTQPH